MYFVQVQKGSLPPEEEFDWVYPQRAKWKTYLSSLQLNSDDKIHVTQKWRQLESDRPGGDSFIPLGAEAPSLSSVDGVGVSSLLWRAGTAVGRAFSSLSDVVLQEGRAFSALVRGGIPPELRGQVACCLTLLYMYKSSVNKLTRQFF
jgi:hypothetical protein